MPELTAENIDLISRDIGKQEISFSHLLDELIDHVCCDVENEMLSGLSFQQAYEKVRLKFTPDCFREIQKDTLYAVDLKYRNMRNTMKISGVAGTILLGFAALFKIQHWPLAGAMMTLGAFSLAIIFLPSSLGVLWKETHNKRRIFLFISAFLTGVFFIAGTLFKVQHWPAAGIILTISFLVAIFMLFPAVIVMIFKNEDLKKFRSVAIVGGTGALLYVIGMLFKIQHWPLAALLIVAGIVMLGYIALPWYTFICWKDEKGVDSKFIFILIGFLAIVVPGTLINLNLQYNYDEGYYLNQSRQNVFYKFLYQNNVSLANDTSGSRIHSKTIDLISYLDNVQENMISEAEGKTISAEAVQDKIVQGPAGLEIRYESLSFPFHSYPVRDFLASGSTTRAEIDNRVKSYLDDVSEMVPGINLSIYRNLLDLSRLLNETSGKDRNISLLSGLHSMILLKNNILVIESAALHSLKSNNLLNASK